MTSEEIPPLQVKVLIPDEWIDVPLDPEQFASELNDALGRLEIGDATLRAQVSAVLRTALVNATDLGLTRLAVWAQLLDPVVGGDPGDVSLLDASISIGIIHHLPSESHSTRSWLAAIQESVRQGEVSALSPPEIVELGEVTAVRILSTMAIEVAPKESISSLHLGYYVPVLHAGSTVVLSFRSTATWISDEMVELFDAIALTCRVDGAVPSSADR